MMIPTIGRTVHYKTVSAEVRPAMVTHVQDNLLTLTVFGIDDTAPGIKVAADNMAAGPDTAQPGQWWWPERIAG